MSVSAAVGGGINRSDERVPGKEERKGGKLVTVSAQNEGSGSWLGASRELLEGTVARRD